MTAWASCGDEAVVRARVHVPTMGAWWADLDLEGDPSVSGRVTVVLGDLELVGTVSTIENGTHAGERRLRVIGGGGGWGALLPARAYHNDSGVLARTVAEDAAREAGEELGSTFDPEASRLGRDYVRQAGPAARALEEAIGGASWWVDYDGTTHVGTRSTTEADREAYEVLEYDPRERVAVIAADDLGAVVVGSILTERLDESQTVRELDVTASAEEIRMRAWCGLGARRGRLADGFARAVERATDGRLFGLWRYRVVRMSVDRVELQAVSAAAGLPDALPISMWPGVGGTHTEPTPGALVLVQFIEGRRTMPVVTHFEGKDGEGWTPANLTLDATTLIKIGKDAAAFAAKADLVSARLDTIQQAFDAHTHIGTATVSTGPVGTIAPPASPIGALASVAASKVKVQ